jgi:RNA-binding protein YlmH
MSIYEHFRREEHPFIDQILDWKNIVQNEYRPKLSDFLDPRQQSIVSSIIGNSDEVSTAFFGGSETAERKRALLHPDYMVPEPEDFEIQAYELEYPAKFVTIDHPQVLGTLMGLGLKREKFGDIIFSGEKIQLAAARETASYIEQQVTSVGKAKVFLRPIALEELLRAEEPYVEEFVTVSSLRLDTVLGEAFRLSRSKVKPFIQSEKTKVNWKVVHDPSFQVENGDMLSMRGKGRCLLHSVEGQTKKGKYRVVLRFFGQR